MSELKILVDMKKYRIRIHKATLRELRYPHYLSLVINPDEYTLGITAGSAEDKTAHRVRTSVLNSRECCELYSSTLIRALLNLCPEWNSYGKYRLTGTFIPEANMVLFDMRTAVFEEIKQVPTCCKQTTH